MKQWLSRLLPVTAALCMALCAAPRADALSFPDVPEEHWAAADAALCVERGFFDGADGEPFYPQEPMRRDVFMAVLCRFFGWPDENPETLPYRDVSPSDWYAGAAAAAYNRGVLVSQAETFRPDEPVTREELAALLVRALGYRTLSGLSEALPFSDVTSNGGYITMAYDFGLMGGSGGLFRPNDAATRIQTAAVLARLARKVDSTLKERISDGIGTGYVQTAVVRTAAERTAARNAGASPLLYLYGETLVESKTEDMAEAAFACDGIYIEADGVYDTTALRALKNALHGKALYLSVPDPRTEPDLPWETLGEIADVLAVRADTGEAKLIGGFPSDPVDPLEEVYAALQTLTKRVPASKLALILDTTGRVWTGGARDGSLSGREAASLRQRADVQTYYSERYACAYLRIPAAGEQAEQVVWYLDEQSVAARLRLLRLFGVGRVFLTDAAGISESVWGTLN